MTPEQAAFITAHEQAREALKVCASAAANLPPLPADAKPPEHFDHLMVVEPGIERWERIDNDSGHWHGHTSGFDAYGDSGEYEYVATADGPFQVPDNLPWD